MKKSKFDKCLLCNRPLKTDISKTRGYGTICWERHEIDMKKSSECLLDKEIKKYYTNKN